MKDLESIFWLPVLLMAMESTLRAPSFVWNVLAHFFRRPMIPHEFSMMIVVNLKQPAFRNVKTVSTWLHTYFSTLLPRFLFGWAQCSPSCPWHTWQRWVSPSPSCWVRLCFKFRIYWVMLGKRTVTLEILCSCIPQFLPPACQPRAQWRRAYGDWQSQGLAWFGEKREWKWLVSGSDWWVAGCLHRVISKDWQGAAWRRPTIHREVQADLFTLQRPSQYGFSFYALQMSWGTVWFGQGLVETMLTNLSIFKFLCISVSSCCAVSAS